MCRREFDVGADVEDASEDAGDVAVHERSAFGKGDTGDGTGGVAADAGEFHQFVGGVRDAGDGGEFGGAVEVFGAGVVAESFPVFEHPVIRGAGEVPDGGERFQPAAVVVEDGFDAGLLEHDFADPDFIGVAGAPPREVAFVVPVPAGKCAPKCVDRDRCDVELFRHASVVILHVQAGR